MELENKRFNFNVTYLVSLKFYQAKPAVSVSSITGAISFAAQRIVLSASDFNSFSNLDKSSFFKISFNMLKATSSYKIE